MTLKYFVVCLLVLFTVTQPTVNGNGRRCPFGNFVTPNGACVECLSTCSRCQNLQAPCQGCSQGYRLSYDQSQCENCDKGQLRCQGSQIVCQKNYKIVYNQCSPVCLVPNCQFCSSPTSTICNNCNSPFVLSADFRVCQQPGIFAVAAGKRNLQQGGRMGEDGGSGAAVKMGSAGSVGSGGSGLGSIKLAATGFNNIDNYNADDYGMAYGVSFPSTKFADSSSPTPQPSPPAAQQIPTPIIPQAPSPPSPQSPLNCQPSQYSDPVQGCQKCSPKCSTCINTADQCLECAQGRIKRGWKCVTAEHVWYQLYMSVPLGNEGAVMTDGVNAWKDDFVNYLLPSIYANQGRTAMTLDQAIFDPSSRMLSASGILDKVGSVKIPELAQSLANNLKVQSFLGPYALRSSNIRAYPLDSQPLTNSTTQTETAPVPLSPVVNNVTPLPQVDPATQSNLAAIITPAVIGVLIFCSAIPLALCYFCKRAQKNNTNITPTLLADPKPQPLKLSAARLQRQGALIFELTPIIDPTYDPANPPIKRKVVYVLSPPYI